MEKQYNHSDFESKIYNLWEKTGAFTPQKKRGKKTFCIIMPPPNSNEDLHIGHARFITIQDILIRYFRMKGFSTLWLPGADHAGIETQYVFEKKLKDQGKSRFDYGRDTLYGMLWDYTLKYKGNMENQLKALGASCDWTRNKFTLDPEIQAIVCATFKQLYEDGLIYRGERIVNYCPRCGTSFSELEVDHKERDDSLYYLDYGTLTIATTRPETIFADVAVAVNPKDGRYKNLIGKTALLPLVKRNIPIISDKSVDIKFGTGALKITPAHDATDFEIGKRHKLSTVSVIDESGKMINTPEKYTGLSVNQAREAVITDLTANGILKKVEPIHHLVSVCYKDQGLIEPTISKQWFVTVKPLAVKALEAINKKSIKFAALKFEKIARHWLRNLKDWNISRQIVWGIRIPAWKCNNCLEWTITEGAVPKECSNCKNANLVQDTDTFDTWFSSAQWPFATLQTTYPGDFEYFYPTQVMETAYDILPFWVIRMIMLGLYKTGEPPFRSVLIHGLVRDSQGKKISKSKGNVINPLEMSGKYGADAVRMGLIWGGLVENDIALSEDKIRGQRNFANKLWNIARYVFLDFTSKGIQNNDDKIILKRLRSVRVKAGKLIEKYRLNEAAELVYNFVWNDFANNYLEKSKNRRVDAQPTLEKLLKSSLIMLHPFMPFITETIWQQGKDRFRSPTLINERWK